MQWAALGGKWGGGFSCNKKCLRRQRGGQPILINALHKYDHTYFPEIRFLQTWKGVELVAKRTWQTREDSEIETCSMCPPDPHTVNSRAACVCMHACNLTRSFPTPNAQLNEPAYWEGWRNKKLHGRRDRVRKGRERERLRRKGVEEFKMKERTM
jgi:hypothetical protein